jgi:hypothetical protein
MMRIETMFDELIAAIEAKAEHASYGDPTYEHCAAAYANDMLRTIFPDSSLETDRARTGLTVAHSRRSRIRHEALAAQHQ